MAEHFEGGHPAGDEAVNFQAPETSQEDPRVTQAREYVNKVRELEASGGVIMPRPERKALEVTAKADFEIAWDNHERAYKEAAQMAKDYVDKYGKTDNLAPMLAETMRLNAEKRADEAFKKEEETIRLRFQEMMKLHSQ